MKIGEKIADGIAEGISWCLTIWLLFWLFNIHMEVRIAKPGERAGIEFINGEK